MRIGSHAFIAIVSIGCTGRSIPEAGIDSQGAVCNALTALKLHVVDAPRKRTHADFGVTDATVKYLQSLKDADATLRVRADGEVEVSNGSWKSGEEKANPKQEVVDDALSELALQRLAKGSQRGPSEFKITGLTLDHAMLWKRQGTLLRVGMAGKISVVIPEGAR